MDSSALEPIKRKGFLKQKKAGSLAAGLLTQKMKTA
jgi:hypothetical protein